MQLVFKSCIKKKIMNWKDIGYLLKIVNYSENSSVASFVTHKHGLHKGVIYGATSKKKKNYLQIGNKFSLNWKSKTEDALGYYDLELKNAVTAKYFDQPDKLNFIQSLSELCCKVLAERYDYSELFNYTDLFINNIGDPNALKFYILWEKELLKSIGFELNPDNKNFNFYKNNLSEWILEIDNKKFFYPNFLIDTNSNCEDTDLYKGLMINKFIFKRFIFEPNKIRFPEVRERIEKKLNEKEQN
jgi:DNA repair protein RecO (recombination protein O)